MILTLHLTKVASQQEQSLQFWTEMIDKVRLQSKKYDMSGNQPAKGFQSGGVHKTAHAGSTQAFPNFKGGSTS